MRAAQGEAVSELVHYTRWLQIAIAGALVCASHTASAEDVEKPDARLVDFTRDVRPILQRACIRCHGPEKQKGDYRLDIRQIAIQGGESYAPNIVPGKAADSPLVKFVSGNGDLVMPPEGDRLSAADVGILRLWIDQGAKWPDDVAGEHYGRCLQKTVLLQAWRVSHP
jgi:hypothetical protein